MPRKVTEWHTAGTVHVNTISSWRKTKVVGAVKLIQVMRAKH